MGAAGAARAERRAASWHSSPLLLLETCEHARRRRSVGALSSRRVLWLYDGRPVGGEFMGLARPAVFIAEERTVCLQKHIPLKNTDEPALAAPSPTEGRARPSLN